MWLIKRRLQRYNLSWQALGFRRFKFSKAFLYIFGFYGVMAIFLIGLVIVAAIVAGLGQPPAASKSSGGLHWQAFPLLGILVTVIITPLLEEVVFRGVLFQALLRRYSGVLSVIISSLIFAAVHLDPAHIISILPLGFYAAIMTHRLGSIWPAVVLHMSWNLLVFFVR